MIDVPVASSLDASIRQRLRVETLLADLSAAFVKIPADQIDSQIEFALKQVVEALGIERSGFGTLSADGALSITHSYEVPGFPPSPRVIVDQELPWYALQIRRGETLRLGRLPDDLPPEAVNEREYCRQTGLKSNLVIPFKVMGSVVGAIGFDSFHSYGDWSDDLIQRLSLIGDIFTHVVARQRAAEALKAAEERANRLQTELAHATRLELVNHLTMSIAHEVNQPLCAIASNAQTAIELVESGNKEELTQTLQDIWSDARRGSEVVAGIRNLLKKQDPCRIETTIDSVVEEVQPLLLREAATRRVRLSVGLDAKERVIVCDRVQLQQVVLNLFVNAVEAVGAGRSGSHEVRIRTSNQKDRVQVTVEDSGPGLTEEECERVFAPFYTSKANGLGMGLAVSRSIIVAHGGTIWATRGSDCGTHFHFQVPAQSGRPS
jgi:signal transduction histidine kinase